MIEKILKELQEFPHGEYADDYGKGFSAGINAAIATVQEVAKEYGKDTNVRSNADRIRSMSDEELAIENLYFISEGALKEGFHYTGLDGRYYKTGEEAFMANMRWLKSEVKE